MAVQHINTSVDRLLEQNTEFLGDLFDMNGKDARLELLELKSKGHKFVPAEGCENFDPLKGCCCAEQISIVRVSESKVKGIEK